MSVLQHVCVYTHTRVHTCVCTHTCVYIYDTYYTADISAAPDGGRLSLLVYSAVSLLLVYSVSVAIQHVSFYTYAHGTHTSDIGA